MLYEVITKPFSSMLMQFLERPDYIVKTMPFTPIKAEWGDVKAANGSYVITSYSIHYTKLYEIAPP